MQTYVCLQNYTNVFSNFPRNPNYTSGLPPQEDQQQQPAEEPEPAALQISAKKEAGTGAQPETQPEGERHPRRHLLRAAAAASPSADWLSSSSSSLPWPSRTAGEGG